MFLLAEFKIFDYVLQHMDIGPAGYYVLFGILLLCGVGLPVPEDVPLIISGMLIGSGHMHLGLAAVLAWCGIIGGDCILYSIGHHYGHSITRVPFIGKHVTLKRIEHAEALFERYGVGFVAIGRLFAGVRGAMVVAAGTVRYNFLKFIIADGLAAVASGGMFMAIGYWFGKNRDLMDEKLREFRHVLLILAIVAAIGLAIYIWWRSKRHERISEVVIAKAATPAPPSAAKQPPASSSAVTEK